MQPPAEETFDVQGLFRQVNERVVDVNGNVGRTARIADFVCECRDPECSEQLILSVAQFDAIRTHPNWHVVRPGHVEPEHERTVEVHRGFSVVERVGTPALTQSQAAA